MNKYMKVIIPATLGALLTAPTADAAQSRYYWHNGDLDDSTVLNYNFKEAIKYNHFTYDGVNLNTKYSTFKRVMNQSGMKYKKVGAGKYKANNSTFIFSLKNGKISNQSTLKGIYFTFDDYSITSTQLKKFYGKPAATKAVNGGTSYTYKGKYNIHNNFDFVKVNGQYRLSGFMTAK